MNINNNFTPLSWHQGNIELQSHRATYAFGHVVPLFASNETLLPFQIITETDAIDLSDFDLRLRKLDGTDAVGSNLSSVIALTKVAFSDKDVIIYPGTAITPALPIGQYYLTLTSGDITWYSDVVTILSDVSKMTRLMWWDEQNLSFGSGIIVYRYADSNNTTVQYKNWMYFQEEVGMPEYTVEEEGETRDGLFYASKVLSGKKYKMQIVQCSEAMCDALRFVHLSDNVEVRDGYLRNYYCDSVLVTPEWINGGTVATAAVEITTDTFVKQLGGGYTGDSPVVEGATGVIGEAVIGETFMIGV